MKNLLVAALLGIPLFAFPLPAAASSGDFAHQPRAREDWPSTSPLAREDALRLAVAAFRAPPSPEEGANLVRYLAQLEGGADEGSFAGALAVHLLAEEARPAGTAQASEDRENVWSTANKPWEHVLESWAPALDAVYLRGSSVEPGMLPHNARALGGYVKTARESGCYYYSSHQSQCYDRVVVDVFGLVALDAHQTTDTILVHSPVASERVRWHYCGYWSCESGSYDANPVVELATDARYTWVFPSSAGEVATRATDHDSAQRAYDRMGAIRFQLPRDASSNPPTTPSGPVGLGVSDLHAVSPRPNSYGFQIPPSGKPAAAAAGAASQDLHFRSSPGYGTHPADAIGMTVEYRMDAVKSWHANVAIVRWKNLGAATAGLDAPPVSFEFAAGWDRWSGKSFVHSLEYAMNDPLV